MSNSDDLTGKTLGTCVLEKLIGKGGMGTVYLARQTRPSRHVAVKVLLPKLSNMNAEVYEAFLARFRREADLVARLEHVNIMPIYEYGEQNGIAYLVMPYLPGGNLRDVLAEYGALSLRETLNYIEQAAAALDYAHAHGVIHRDIKPSNFLLHTDGRLVLADFGIARMMSDGSSTIGATLTGTGMLLGTPEYMAPEMARGEPIDARSDVYELGVVLFQMLSGRVPFQGNTPLAVVVKHLEEQLPPLRQIKPTIPSAVDSVVQKATAKRREDRYQSAGALAQALRLAISSPDYPLDTIARNAPTVLSSQPLVQPPPARTPASAPMPAQGTSSLIADEQDMIPTTLSAPDRSHGTPPLAIPVTPAAPTYPDTPYTPRPMPPPRPGLQPWLLLVVALLIIAIAIGGVFVGLQLRGTATPIQPTVIFAPTPVPPTPVPPTPVPPTLVPPTPIPPTLPPPPPPSPAQQAQATVQEYYNDINNQDYQGAYNLLASGGDYNHFAAGYATTVHVDVTFGNIIPLSDGTFQVYLTIQALDNTSSGQVTSTFQGYYVVGLVNGSWKLLHANIQKTS